MSSFSEWFWNDSFWFPDGVSFRDFEDSPDITYAKPRDMLYVPVIGLAIFGFRILFERFIALPIAKYHQVSDGKERKPPKPNVKLEKFYKEISRHPTEEQVDSISKRFDIPRSSVRSWFRRKRNWGRPDTQTKFLETSWRFVFYSGVFAYGFGFLWKAPWLWDHAQCWIGFPHQNLDKATYIYYIAEASFYTSLLLSIMKDVRRKDFFEQLIHHIATLFLIIFSYFANFVRVGTLVMAIHDISDIFLEGAKCVSYLKYAKTSEILFIIFAITFIVTRIIIFPFWIIHTSAIKSFAIIGPFASCYFFNALLGVLQCLHLYWASIILRMAWKMLFPVSGEALKDDRSDTEELSADDEDQKKDI
ncbi:ceramide synthase 5-like [Styela clava]